MKLDDFFKFLKKNHKLILILILLLATGIRLYYFSQTLDQPLWWDEGDYMTLAKKWGAGIVPEMQVKDIWSPRRPFLMPIIWSVMFMAGLGELGARLLQLMLSIGCVYLIYLLGKEMYNKNVGLISAFLMSIFYLQIFFTPRLLLEIPSLFFVTATLYFFWKGYVKKDNKSILLTGIFLGLAIFTRAANILIVVPMFFIALFENKLTFLKEKRFWLSILLMFLVLSPFILYLFANYSNPLQKFTGVGEGRFSKPTLDVLLQGNTLKFIKFFPTYLKFPLFYLFLIGLVIFLDFLLGLDFIFKKEGKEVRKKSFLILWILTILLFFGITTSQSYMEPRYLMNIFPAVFIIISVALMKGYNIILRFNRKFKIVAVILMIIILLIGAYNHITFADSLIDTKKTSFLQIKQAGLWVKENSQVGDAIISNSIPQNIYYSERPTYMIGKKTEERIKELNPKFWVASIYERSGEWFYEYPTKQGFKPVMTYSLDGKPSLIIYQMRD